IISLYWITYYQAKQQKTSSPVSKKTASITTNINRNINELPQFKPIKPCVLSYIHRAQAEFVLDELITGAEKTKFFTIVPKFNSLYIDYMFMHIELIQDSQTIIALIEYFNETDRNSQYYHKLQQFFTITFNSSKIIQTWGNLIDQLIPYIQYGLFTCNEISQVKSINVQKEFKLWYNNIFRHHLQCHHYLKYDEIDGSLCSCIHRPYKASSCQWSISKAIAYTFDERYDYYTHDIHKCLAITKLGYVNVNTTYFDDIFRPLLHELNAEAKDLHLNMNIEEDYVKENIPDYLSASNSSFKAHFLPELGRFYNPIDFSDLQYLAILTHKLSLVNFHRKLWHIYLKCGTHQFNEREQLQQYQQQNITRSLCIWPFPVTSMIIAQHYNNITYENEITYDIYVNFVKKNLFQLDAQASQYQHEFDSIKERIDNSSDALAYKIDEFIQKNDHVTAIRHHFEARAELMEYTYLDQLLQFKYLQQKPNEEQIKLVQNICTRQLEKEKSEQELILFRYGFLFKKLPDSLKILEESPPKLITTIIDPHQRERLSNNYTRIIQQAKVDLMMILTTGAEIKRQEHQKVFDMTMAKLWTDQRHLPIDKRLTTTMLSFIDERQKNIIKCVKCIYALKTSFFMKT
ncbi:unnamed protein product, partial [Rotaria sordida]